MSVTETIAERLSPLGSAFQTGIATAVLFPASMLDFCGPRQHRAADTEGGAKNN